MQINILLDSAYVLAGVVTAGVAIRALLDHEAANNLRRRERMARSRWRDEDRYPRGMTAQEYRALRIAEEGPLLDAEGRFMMIAFGLLLGFIWPLYWMFRVVSRTVGRGPTASDVLLAERLELAELRILAREHGLPMPGQEEATDGA